MLPNIDESNGVAYLRELDKLLLYVQKAVDVTGKIAGQEAVSDASVSELE